MPKIYAYVTSECVSIRDAENPGAYIGERRVSQCHDYLPWFWGKRKTIAIANDYLTHLDAEFTPHSAYIQASAKAVCRLKGWTYAL